MWFRVLGTVEVHIGGGPVDVGHVRQRTVLAVLLAETGRAVATDQLIDRVWGGRPPQRARETLYGYLSRLRGALPGRIGRRSGGYLLDVEPSAVDLHRFRQLVQQARTAPDEPAAGLWEEALGLWRGEAFEDLPAPWLRDLATGLAAERFAAMLDRNDVLLRSGGHARLLPELSAAAAVQPLDERLAGQLMLALYRDGRHSDALDHYRTVQRRLAAELGSDPGPELRRLHQRMLRHDPGLAVPAGPGRVGPAGGPVIPAQLPADIPGFAGRADPLRQLDALLAARPDGQAAAVISAISGMAGVGKTALAVHWAHRVRDRFPDGQLYLNLRGFDPGGASMSAADAVRGFLDALQVPAPRIPAGLDAQIGLYRSLLAGKRTLVVLDNARDAEQVRPLLPGAAGCLAVVTSRNQLTGLAAVDGARLVRLAPLAVAEARQLLAHRLGRDRVAGEPGAVDDLVAGCGRLPLALAVIAARAAARPEFPLAALAGELSDARASLDALDGGDPVADVRAVFSWSYRALSPGAARLFRLLGLHPGPDLAAPAVAGLAGEPMRHVCPLLAELVGAHLLTEPVSGRFALHDLLRSYAAELAHREDTDADRTAAQHRMFDHYLHTAHAADALLNPQRPPVTLAAPSAGTLLERVADRDQAMAWFASECLALLAAVDQSAGAGLDVHTWHLGWVLLPFLERTGHWTHKAATQRAAVRAAVRMGDRSKQAHAHRCLGHAYGSLGRSQDAQGHLEQALAIHRELGDHVGEGHALMGLAFVFDRQGRYDATLHHTERALERYELAGHRVGQARAMNNIGWCHTKLGDHQQALSYCRRALELHREFEDRSGEAAAWDSLGHAHRRLGDHLQAVSCYRRAVALYRESGDRYSEADKLAHLGDAQRAAGDHGLAREAWKQALAILEELDHPDADHVRAKLTAG